MKTIKLFSFLIFFLSLALIGFAGEIKTETLKVFGNCDMCKARIEKAAKGAGAESADWSTETKMLTIKFDNSTTDATKIQQAIAAVGHDTRDFKAPDEVYDKLPGCCKYERAKSDQAILQSIEKEKCSKGNMNCTSKDCCKDGNCSKEKTSQATHEGNHSMMNCVMNGKAKKVS